MISSNEYDKKDTFIFLFQHASMGGGLIPKEHLAELGQCPEDFIRNLFLDTLSGN